MAIPSYDTIVSNIIDGIWNIYPDADVKSGTVLRDLFIDVQSTQIGNLYSILDNALKAQSVSTAVDQMLDMLGYNVGQKRNPATQSTTNLTVNIKAGLQAPEVCNVGDQFYTTADANNPSIVFVNTQYTLVQPGTNQITLPLVSLNTGFNTQVPANSITNSSYDFADSVYNENAATGGQDIESNASFQNRIPFALTGLYINTWRGIVNTVLSISDINGQPYPVTPDNPLSRGPYTLDVYLKRVTSYSGTVINETAPANMQDYVFSKQPLYSLNPINQITTFDAITNTSQVVPASNYKIINDSSDVLQDYVGSVKANQKLHWITAPPVVPYTISYNYDHTIIDAQSNYDNNNEMTADTLFKQAIPIPLYISAVVTAKAGTNPTSIYSTSNANLANLFNSLGNSLTDNQAIYSIRNNTNILDVNITNLDTTHEISLNMKNSSGFLTPDFNSQITPFGFYLETGLNFNIGSRNIVARLWIGNPDIISPNNFSNGTFNFNALTNSLGVQSKDVINGYFPSWNTNTDFFFDSTSQTVILSFSAQPSNTDTITLNIVQNNINNLSDISYLTLAPSITNSVQAYTTVGNATPTYAVTLPNQIASIENATLYKNGVALTPASSTNVGDYTILKVDPNTGLIIIQFTVQPASTDILTFGILNPNIVVNYASS